MAKYPIFLSIIWLHSTLILNSNTHSPTPLHRTHSAFLKADIYGNRLGFYPFDTDINI